MAVNGHRANLLKSAKALLTILVLSNGFERAAGATGQRPPDRPEVICSVWCPDQYVRRDVTIGPQCRWYHIGKCVDRRTFRGESCGFPAWDMTSTSAGLSRHAKKRNVLIPMGGSLNSNRRLFEFAASNLFDDVDNVFVFHYERKHNPSDPTPATQRQGFQIVNIDKPLDTPPDSSEAEDHGSKAAEADWLPRAVSDALSSN